MGWIIYIIIWLIALIYFKFNFIIIFLGFAILIGIANGVRKYKAEQYLADKYDEEKRKRK
jgi:H+/gluconate symporter-like permease